ncbi:hypothetical protein ST201phi2-1p172 [Pseudomonas phage 201phi2-1]|uniref:Uncharacterized protein n=1 Tax=Pseudomonas phage 201phi2-1 TaxID=198110 RepID=B3FJ35_BP201|nr:hypothetical protein ST201phi2-1p172 [Pseudomonas phage 201phi2-1]ABY63002.1 hypothetical protein 201phi2-1p172 [Pseudomonas phage 201phi2-1]
MAYVNRRQMHMEQYFSDREKLDAPYWAIDDNLDSIVCNVRDPFATYVDPSNYDDDALAYRECMDGVVAGVSEALGLPQGLSFEEVFERL